MVDTLNVSNFRDAKDYPKNKSVPIYSVAARRGLH
jgi:hypothetical protein